MSDEEWNRLIRDQLGAKIQSETASPETPEQSQRSEPES
jgi:hypothetical protein